MRTFVVDSLTTAQPSAALPLESGSQEALANVVRRPRRQAKVLPDSTVQQEVKPSDVKPLPEGLPLTMKPRVLDVEYWKYALTHVEKSPFVQELDSVTHTRSDSVLSLQPKGIAGDPVPYQFRTDSVVTSLIMLSFFCMVWVISRSRRYLQLQLKQFFRQRQRENLFVERTQTEMRGQVFLIFQTCFLLGVLFFDYTQERQEQVFNLVSPYWLLGTSVAICCLYYLLKISLYSFVNNVFFTARQRAQWSQAYLLCVLGLGVMLLPVTLLVVYFDLSFQNMFVCVLILLLFDKLLLIYKSFSIFFGYTFGWVHLILYFCTLEIVPLLMLFRAIAYVNNLLMTII